MSDQVLVIGQDRIVERGDYESLLRAGTCRQRLSRGPTHSSNRCLEIDWTLIPFGLTASYGCAAGMLQGLFSEPFEAPAWVPIQMTRSGPCPSTNIELMISEGRPSAFP